MAVDSGAPDYEGGGLSRETNWWGAFVIGLAGTILVTGIAPVMVTSLGAAAIPVMVVITITGYLLCLLLAELSAMMPERTGGSPTYAYVAYKDKWPRFAKHVNGFTSWAYWLGWFPVAPLNMILASFYIVDKFGLSTKGFTPIHTPIAYWTIVISVVGILLVFIPAWLGIRLGAMFATVLGLLSMIPLTLLAIMPFLHPSAANWGNLSGFHQLDGSSFFSADLGHNWLVIYIAFSFLLTWNVIAMEAAACYIGECRDPERDAKIAMNLEGLYGLFIYTMIPVAFVVVLGATKLSDPLQADPKTIFSTFATAVFGTGASWLDWTIAIMLDHRALALGAERDHGLGAGAAPDVDRRRVPAHLLEGQPARRARASRWASTSCARSPSSSPAARSRSTRSRTSATWRRSSRCWSATTCCASTGPTCAARSGCRSSSSTSPWRWRPATSSSGATAASSTRRSRTRSWAGRTPAIYFFIGWVILLVVPAALLVPDQGRGSQVRQRGAAGRAADRSRRLITGSRVGAVFRRASPPPDPATLRVERLVVASEGRPIDWTVLQQAFELARPATREGARDLDRAGVGDVARVSQPAPQPEQARVGRPAAARARGRASALEKAGFDASGHVVGTRRAAKRIVARGGRLRRRRDRDGCRPRTRC